MCFLASRRSTQEPLGQAAGRHRPGARLVNEGEAEPGSSPKKAANGYRLWSIGLGKAKNKRPETAHGIAI